MTHAATTAIEDSAYFSPRLRPKGSPAELVIDAGADQIFSEGH
jgi:hypothetical protein